MDQTTPENKGVLWDIHECGENSNLDRYLSLRARRYRQKKTQSGSNSLHNFTDFECYAFRENAHFASVSAVRLHRAPA
jgi:hypothetical protein